MAQASSDDHPSRGPVADHHFLSLSTPRLLLAPAPGGTMISARTFLNRRIALRSVERHGRQLIHH